MNFVDRAIERRCAGSKSDGLHIVKPPRGQLVRTFYVQRWRQILMTETDQLARVVRVVSADHYNRVGTPDQVQYRALTTFCRLADRIDEAYIGEWVMKRDLHTDCIGLIGWRRGLAYDSQPPTLVSPCFCRGTDDIAAV